MSKEGKMAMTTKPSRDLWQFGRADVLVLKLVLAAALVGYPVLVPRVVDWVRGGALVW